MSSARSLDAATLLAPSAGLVRLAGVAYALALLGGASGATALATPAQRPYAAPAVTVALLAAAGVAVLAVGGSLSVRIGGNRALELGLLVPALPFLLLGFASAPLGTVGYVATIAIAATGVLLGTLARNRHVAARVESDPVVTSPWTPDGSRRIDLVLIGLWAFLAAGNVADGAYRMALLWLAMGAGWALQSVNAGRLFAAGGTDPEISVHEEGLVKRRRFTASVVPWGAVSHARVREQRLVLDRGGPFDVRVDADGLTAADDAFDAIEDALGDRGVAVL